MKIYADVFFLVNAFVNYFLLLATGKLLNLKSKGIRLIAASVFGALASFISLLSLNKAIEITVTLITSLLLTALSFGFKRPLRLIVNTLCFILFSTLFSGINLLLINLFGINALVINGKVYYDINLLMLIIFTGVFYLCLSLISNIVKMHKDTTLIHKLTFSYKGSDFTLSTFLDTGNSLKEPFSGAPVIIISKRLLKDCSIKDESLRLIPYKTVKGEGLLYGFKPDFIEIDGLKTEKECYIAIFEGDFGINKDGLIPPELLK